LPARSQAGAVPPGEARSARVAYALLAPGVLLFLAIVVVPIVQTVWRSFYLWDGVTTPEWVGIDNYREVISDPQVHAALRHSAVLFVFSCVLPVTIGLLLAVLLSRVQIRGLSVFRTLLFSPQVLSGIAIGIIWRWMYEPTDGPINMALVEIGLPGWAKPWLGDFTFALPAIGVIGMWATMGFCMVLFLAGVQKIPQSLYDAARVDGARWFAELRSVTLPGLRNELIVAVTITLIISLRIFDIVYVTTHGGPGEETTVPSLLIYDRAFQYGFVGSGAALAVVMGVIILSLSMLVQRFGERRRA
jgi:raffinose/stachyose/melibiose transport system permease protein